MKRYSVIKSKRGCIFAFASVILAATSLICFGAESEAPPGDYFFGKYEVAGRKPDSKTTYSGTVELKPGMTGIFLLIRRIGGREITGEAEISHADPLADHPAVLLIRFHENGREFEGTFLWRSDLDNYPRLTGLISEPGKTKSAGIEAWFPVHPR